MNSLVSYCYYLRGWSRAAYTFLIDGGYDHFAVDHMCDACTVFNTHCVCCGVLDKDVDVAVIVVINYLRDQCKIGYWRC